MFRKHGGPIIRATLEKEEPTMNARNKSILIGFISALFLLGAVLSLPLLMNRTMEGSLNLTATFAEEAAPADPTSAPALATAGPQDAGETLLSPAPEESRTPMSSSTPSLEGMPLFNLEGNNWRRLMTRIQDQQVQMDDPGFAPLFGLLGITDLEDRLVSGYQDKSSGLILLESHTTRDAAYQKVFAGLLSNLDSDSIFLPRQTLSAYEDRIVLAATLGLEGRAVFLMPNRGLVPYAVMQYAGKEGHLSLTREQYLMLEEDMMESALKALPPEEGQRLEACLNKALSILQKGQAEGGEDRFAFINAQPFQFKMGWDYLAAGYHLKMVDTQSAREYTVSVDLISGGMGIAEEGTSPYLDLHARMVMQDRENTAWQMNPEPVMQRSDELFKLLAGPGWQEEKQGMAQSISSVMSNMDQPVMQVEMVPEDLDQRLLDQENAAPYARYTLQMDRDLKLLHFDVQTMRLKETEISDSITLYLPTGGQEPVSMAQEEAYHEANVQFSALIQKARKWDTSGNLALVLGNAEGEQSQLVDRALNLINQTGGSYRLEEALPGQDNTVNLWMMRQVDNQQKTHYQVRMVFSVQDEEGKYYHVAFRVNQDMSISILYFSLNELYASRD